MCVRTTSSSQQVRVDGYSTPLVDSVHHSTAEGGVLSYKDICDGASRGDEQLLVLETCDVCMCTHGKQACALKTNGHCSLNDLLQQVWTSSCCQRQEVPETAGAPQEPPHPQRTRLASTQHNRHDTRTAKKFSAKDQCQGSFSSLFNFMQFKCACVCVGVCSCVCKGFITGPLC